MTFARERLRRDWVEVSREPSLLVAAEPLPNNIFEWHANLRPSSGVLAGVTFHVRITFPTDYPNSPPFLHFPREEIPSFRHPNLYSFGLCLDILSSFIGTSDERAGWSPAYTVRTLLMQLQSFLFEFDSLPQDHGGTYRFRYDAHRIRQVREEASRFVCTTCGHCSRSPQPALQAESIFGAVCPPAPVQQASASRAASWEAIEDIRRRLRAAREELATLPAQEEVTRREVDEHGQVVMHAGQVVGHLSAARRRISVRLHTL